MNAHAHLHLARGIVAGRIRSDLDSPAQREVALAMDAVRRARRTSRRTR
ncbi:hypothetical protein [Nocardioides dongkuii]|nr:hypothetical protein [Nocardioides dongkuii]